MIACTGRRNRDLASGWWPHCSHTQSNERWLLAGHISTSLAGVAPWTWQARPGPVPVAAQTAMHPLTGALTPCAVPVAGHTSRDAGPDQIYLCQLVLTAPRCCG